MGLEVGNQIVVVDGPDHLEDVEDQMVEVTSVTVEDEPEPDQPEVETVDFDCPDAGFFPSQTNCAQYYQCTADRTVIIIIYI